MQLSALGSRLSAGPLLVLAACVPGPATTTPPPQAPAAAAAAVPSTDIYLYRLSRGLIPFRSRLVNITNRPGYDNQPSFDASAILYTSIRDGQADIYRFENGRSTSVTTTPESEYSAAITPDGKAISVVRVERDSTQRLWRFPNDSSEPSLVLRDIKPVGYFAWLDSTTLALFVLGTPNTLQIADTRTGAGRVVTTNIGRSLQRVPGGRRASFVHRVGDKWVLKTVNPEPRTDGSWDIETVATLPDSADYVVWKSPTELYTAAGSRIFRMRRPSTRWEPIADLAGSGLKRISRLAIHPNGGELALVAEDRTP
jgi:WD40 repeat protein